MKYLVKLLSYLKYTITAPLAGLMLWFSLRFTQGLFSYIIDFINERQLLEQNVQTFDPETGSAVEIITVWEFLNRSLYTFCNFTMKLAYYLNKWLPVEFVISWGFFVMEICLVLVVTRLVIKIITVGQF